jgi:hypothetical protein
MKSCEQLQQLNSLLLNLNINELWSNAQHIRTVKLTKKFTIEDIVNDSKLFTKSYGVYKVTVVGSKETAYVGMALRSNGARRAYSHLYSFMSGRKTESTGKHLRSIVENTTDGVILTFDFIDLTNTPLLISAIEQRSIKHFKPIINSQV